MKIEAPELKELLAGCAVHHYNEHKKWRDSRLYKEHNNLWPPQSKELEQAHYDWATACEQASDLL